MKLYPAPAIHMDKELHCPQSAPSRRGFALTTIATLAAMLLGSGQAQAAWQQEEFVIGVVGAPRSLMPWPFFAHVSPYTGASTYHYPTTDTTQVGRIYRF